MSFVFRSMVEFLTDQKQLSKSSEYNIGSLLTMPVTISKIKDLLLLYENYLVDVITIHCPDSIEAHLLQIHKMTKKIVHDISRTIAVFLRMKFYLLHITGIPSSNSQKIRIMECPYEQ